MSIRSNRIRLMSFVSRYFSLLRILRLPAILLVLAAGGVFVYMYLHLPQECGESRDAISVRQPTWPELPPEQSLDWSQFRGSGGSVKLGQPDFAKKFRFAGTFFISGEHGEEVHKAVLSVESEGRQVIASEGDEIAGAIVTKITVNSVVLKCGSETVELFLSFSSAEEGKDTVEKAKPAPIDRFGKVVSKNSRELRRDSLLDYYYELMDEPERLLNVFDSLKPLYGENNRITGYKLGVEGEDDFFAAVGLQEGDIIKKVNSLKMTSRRRAEFFIKQVVANKLSAVVIDIERDGKPKRLVYRVR